MILVTGATGTVGREVVAQLLAARQKVRAMTRNPMRAKLDSRVEVVRGNFEDPASLETAVRGVDRVFSLTVGPQTGLHEKNLAEAAKAARMIHPRILYPYHQGQSNPADLKRLLQDQKGIDVRVRALP